MALRHVLYRHDFTIEEAKQQLRGLIVLAVEGDDSELVLALTKPLFDLYWALRDHEDDENGVPDEEREIWTQDEKDVLNLYCTTYWKAVCKLRGRKFSQEIVDQNDGNQPIEYDLQDALDAHRVRVPEWFVREWALTALDHDLAFSRAMKRVDQRIQELKAQDPARSDNDIIEQACREA
jgi:hypothetical protein